MRPTARHRHAHGRRGVRAAHRPGFVLPMVILLVLVVGLTAAIMLERYIAQARDVGRQADAYRVHHAVRGIQEVLNAWLRQQTASAFRDLLDEDGLAVTIDPGDGTELELRFADAQGGLLVSDVGVSEDVALDLREAGEALVRRFGPERSLEFLRRDGPAEISVHSAPREVLVALIEAVTDGDAASAVVASLLEASEDDEALDRQRLGELLSDPSLPSEARAKLTRLLTTDPLLYRMDITVRQRLVAGPRGIVSRFEALLLLPEARRRALDNTPTFERPPPFLWWRELPLDAPPIVPPRGPGRGAAGSRGRA